MLASPIESELMRGDLKAGVRKFSRPDFIPSIDQNIKHPAAFLTDEMLMALYQRIEVLRPPDHQHL